MIRLGTALKSQEPPFHRCLILSDPLSNGGQIVLVRITTNDGTWPDQDCILTSRDWDQLEHESTVAFSTTKYGPAMASLEAAIQRGLFQEIPSPPTDVLRRIIDMARVSPAVPPAAKRLLGQI